MSVNDFEAEIYRVGDERLKPSIEERNKASNTATSLDKPKRRVRNGKAIVLLLPPKVVAAIDNICQDQGGSRSNWIRGTIMRGLKNWRSPFDNSTIWSKCNHCGKKHDPSVHGLDEF